MVPPPLLLPLQAASNAQDTSAEITPIWRSQVNMRISPIRNVLQAYCPPGPLSPCGQTATPQGSETSRLLHKAPAPQPGRD